MIRGSSDQIVKLKSEGLKSLPWSRLVLILPVLGGSHGYDGQRRSMFKACIKIRLYIHDN